MGEREFRVEHDSMGEVRVPAAAKWRAQTQRAVENFPISGRTLEAAHIAALGHVKAAAATVNAELGVLDKDLAAAIAEAAREVADGEVGRPVPRRRVPDRVRDLVQHERQRGRGDAGAGAARPPRPPQRPRERLPVVQRRVPVVDPHRGDRGRPRRPDPRPEASAERADPQGGRVPHGGEVRPHAPHGRHAGDAGPGVRRVRRADRARRGAAGGGVPRLAELPLGGTAVGTGINTPPGFAGRVIERDRAGHGPAADRGPRPLRGAGRAGRRWWRPAARSARSR